MFYVRKVVKSKWANKDVSDYVDLEADALYSLESKNNKISVWKIDSIEDINKELLEIASALNTSRDAVSKTDLVIYDANIVDGAFKVEKSPGASAMDYLNDNNHYDIVEMNISHLLKLSEMTFNLLSDEKGNRTKYIRFNANVIKGKLAKINDVGGINLSKCNANLKSKIEEGF